MPMCAEWARRYYEASHRSIFGAPGDEQPESPLSEAARKCAEGLSQLWMGYLFAPIEDSMFDQRPDESAEQYRERIHIQ